MISGPGISNGIEYGYQGPGDLVMGTGESLTMSQDIVYESITLNDDAVINTNGYRIKILGELVMNGSSWITCSGEFGDAGDDGGLGGTGGSGFTVGFGFPGGNGANVTLAADGQPGEADINQTSLVLSFNGGNGGAGTDRAAGAGGLSQYDYTSWGEFINSHFAELGVFVAGLGVGQIIIPTAGSGGGGGGADLTTLGGGGGGGGGHVHISAFRIRMNETSLISAQGGGGGLGRTMGGGLSGGGGGGCGGVVTLHTWEVLLDGNATITCPGGPGGTGQGGGGNGVGGDDGNIIILSEKGFQEFNGTVRAPTYTILPAF